jgi:hypothetical protein
MTIAAGLIQSITVETTVSPPFILDDPFGSNAAPNAILSLLKPKVSIQLAGGGQPLVSAPYGDPGAGWYPYIKLFLFGAAMLFLARLVLK